MKLAIKMVLLAMITLSSMSSMAYRYPDGPNGTAGDGSGCIFYPHD